MSCCQDPAVADQRASTSKITILVYKFDVIRTFFRATIRPIDDSLLKIHLRGHCQTWRERSQQKMLDRTINILSIENINVSTQSRRKEQKVQNVHRNETGTQSHVVVLHMYCTCYSRNASTKRRFVRTAMSNICLRGARRFPYVLVKSLITPQRLICTDSKRQIQYKPLMSYHDKRLVNREHLCSHVSAWTHRYNTGVFEYNNTWDISWDFIRPHL